MRIALAQIDTVVGDLDGNRAKILQALARGPGLSRADLSSSPSSRRPGTRPRISSCAPPSCARRARRVDQIAAADGRHHRARRDAVVRRRPRQRLRGVRGWRASERSTASTTCRTTASSTSTATSRRAATSSCCAWAASRSGSRSARTSGSPARRRPISLSRAPQLVVNLSASPYHVGKAEDREEMLVTRARDTSVVLRLLQPRRRPGRAGLRRALGRDRRLR